jgi:hypothetical protein
MPGGMLLGMHLGPLIASFDSKELNGNGSVRGND